jgi:hypothetical protein
VPESPAEARRPETTEKMKRREITIVVWCVNEETVVGFSVR